MTTSFARATLLGARHRRQHGHRLRHRRAAAHDREHRIAAIGARRTRRGDAEQGRPPRTRPGADRPGDIGSPRRHCVCRQLTRWRIHSFHSREKFMNRLIATALLAGALISAGAANAMPGAPWCRHRTPMSSKSPADAARAGIAGPMADAGATTPIRRRTPARADGISDHTAVAAPTGRRDFDHVKTNRFSHRRLVPAMHVFLRGNESVNAGQCPRMRWISKRSCSIEEMRS